MGKLLRFLLLFSFVVFAFTAYVTYVAAYQLSDHTTGLISQDAANKAIKYINEQVLNGKANASLIDITEESGLYKIHILIGQNEYYSFVSKDGKLLFEQGIYMEESEAGDKGNALTEVPKSDRPDVKIFVMSYCPYGLQAEKMMLPVYELLDDKIDIGIYFVDYVMHGKQELDENLRQYCIQQEEESKYLDYLSCFIEEGNCDSCLSEAGIDLVKLNSCMAITDSTYNVTGQYNNSSTWLNGYYPIFDVQKDLNEQYGVRGSPTIVINGKIVNITPRTPENLKQAVCSAFNSSPAECSQTLSNEVPSAGFEETSNGSKSGSEN